MASLVAQTSARLLRRKHLQLLEVFACTHFTLNHSTTADNNTHVGNTGHAARLDPRCTRPHPHPTTALRRSFRRRPQIRSRTARPPHCTASARRTRGRRPPALRHPRVRLARLHHPRKPNTPCGAGQRLCDGGRAHKGCYGDYIQEEKAKRIPEDYHAQANIYAFAHWAY